MTIAAPMSEAESPYAWTRLLASLALMTISGVGMYGVSVALPAVQAEFGITRSGASLPYAATFTGLGLFCAATMIPLAFVLRRRPPVLNLSGDSKASGPKKIDIPRNALF